MTIQTHGFAVFHDVPIGGDGWYANIDHVAIGRQGVVVIETKMRSKPKDVQSGDIRVEFDGTKISWPRHSSDTKTLWQVRKNAEWMARFIEETCDLSVSIGQVIAIPGWKVDEKVLKKPRVVSGRGVSDAVVHSAGVEMALSRDEHKRICDALRSRCRDVSI